MKIVIVGAGRVGYAIAEQLLTEGHDITVVESDPERAAYISSTLEEPEYLAAYSYTENGVTVEEPEQKNPYYISGVKRQVYECLLDLTPGGQVIQIGEMGAKKPVMLAVYDGLILLLVTGFGLVLFRREDLK